MSYYWVNKEKQRGDEEDSPRSTQEEHGLLLYSDNQ